MSLAPTPIVAYGLGFLLLLLSFFGVERLNEIRKSLGGEAESLSIRRSVVENVKSQNHWEDRLAYSEMLKKQLDASIWQASTGGVIAAELQQFLRRITEDNGFKNITIRVDPNPAIIDEIHTLAFDFAGVVEDATGSINLLEQFSQYERQIILNDINIIYDPNGQRNTRVVLSGFIPIQLSGTSEQESEQEDE